MAACDALATAATHAVNCQYQSSSFTPPCEEEQHQMSPSSVNCRAGHHDGGGLAPASPPAPWHEDGISLRLKRSGS